jgi:RNA polymerase sigma factor (sigma-70 family)
MPTAFGNQAIPCKDRLDFPPSISEMQDASVRVEREGGAGLHEHGDVSIEVIYRSHGERLWRAVFLYAGDREIASDAVAEAFAQAIRRGRAIRSPVPWITRAAFRIAAGELKERRRHAELVAAPSYDMSESAVDLIIALRKIPERQRAAIVLRYYGGFSYPEIAKMTESTPGAVAVDVHRGRRRLRDLVGGTDG